MRNYSRYTRQPEMDFPQREWPGKRIETAPVWVSVDLRDGNQALIDPMVLSERLELFDLLVELGFSQIEVGCPASNESDREFVRKLIEDERIPDNVTIQVLSDCTEEEIRDTFEAIEGAGRAIVHICHPASALFRELYGISRAEVMKTAQDAAAWVRKYMDRFDGEITPEYSPECFTETEPDFALALCTAVQKIWQPTPEHKAIFNLPSTVERNTPNVYADRIEWMSRHFEDRDSIILSVHAHNDRGCAVAATELALLAGAERVEGTLFGNGERTGNADLLTLAYNMFSQGIDPGLNLENIGRIAEIWEHCTKMSIDERRPYVGKLVFTAFSDLHQDAIERGVAGVRETQNSAWNVPYLTVDPADIGRVYEAVAGVGVQSVRGGVAYIMNKYYGFKLPKGMHREFEDAVRRSYHPGGKVDPEQIMDAFRSEYMYQNEPLHFRRIQVTELQDDDGNEFDTRIRLIYTLGGESGQIRAEGNGPLDAVKRGFAQKFGINIRILDYEEHALKAGSDSQAAAYIHMLDENTGRITYGVGVSSNITRASVRAIFSGVNRLQLLHD